MSAPEKKIKELSQEEKQRAKRQALIHGWDQSVFKNACAFIAGVGALGCEISKDLALMGIGKLMLCDMDKIETSNLSRQMLFYKGDEGSFKAEKAAERLKLMSPFLETEVFTIPLQKVPMEKYKECDVLVMALDNVQARTDLNKFALKLGIPCVEGGTVGFEGHVQVILPESTRDANGNPIPFGNKDAVIEKMVDNMLVTLDEEKYKGYFNGQKDINALQEKINAIKMLRIDPVMDELKQKAETEFDANPQKFINHTACYQCVVPTPPPPAKQAAACTLKGIPRTRGHCALRGEVLFIKAHERNPDVDDLQDMIETTKYAKQELEGLRARVLEENIPEERANISEEELNNMKKNIVETFGNDFTTDDVEREIGHKIPAVQSVSAIISATQSQEILKLIFLKAGKPIGSIMDPPYVNYNGIYGQFDHIPVVRREECIACGNAQGQENVQVAVASDGTIGDIFKALKQLNLPIALETWMITNPMTKNFVYNPMFEQGKTQDKKLADAEIKSNDELTFTPFGKAKEGAEIKQYNVTVQLL